MSAPMTDEELLQTLASLAHLMTRLVAQLGYVEIRGREEEPPERYSAEQQARIRAPFPRLPQRDQQTLRQRFDFIPQPISGAARA